MGQVIFFQKCFHLLTGDGEHGANHIAADGADAPQSFQPRAPQQVHQHGFGVVVRRVRRGNLAGERAQKGVSGLPGGGFQPLFAGLHLRPAHFQRDAVTGAEAADEVFVLVGFFPPQVMVKMGSAQSNAQLVFQQVHSKQQRNGIRPAGHGTGNTVAGENHFFLPQRGAELIQHVSTPGRQTAGTGASIAASPHRFRRGGFWRRCTRQCPCLHCWRCNIRPGTGT